MKRDIAKTSKGQTGGDDDDDAIVCDDDATVCDNDVTAFRCGIALGAEHGDVGDGWESLTEDSAAAAEQEGDWPGEGGKGRAAIAAPTAAGAEDMVG